PTTEVLGSQVRVTDGVTPVPERRLVGAFVALLVTATVLVALPATVGAKSAVKMTDCPGAKPMAPDRPLSVNPAPEIVAPEMFTVELPVFTKRRSWSWSEPRRTLPNAKLLGLN